MALWWAPCQGGLPPIQLTPPGVRVVHFGWAPSAEEEVDLESNGEEDEYEEEQYRQPEYVIAPRLWVTLQRGLAAQTHLADLHGNLLGCFELPVSGAAVSWLVDGRRVLVTESAGWFPSLWDGAALLPLPVPAGFGEIRVEEVRWCSSERKGAGVVYSMRTTAADAPFIVVPPLPSHLLPSSPVLPHLPPPPRLSHSPSPPSLSPFPPPSPLNPSTSSPRHLSLLTVVPYCLLLTLNHTSRCPEIASRVSRDIVILTTRSAPLDLLLQDSSFLSTSPTSVSFSPSLSTPLPQLSDSSIETTSLPPPHSSNPSHRFSSLPSKARS